MAKQALASKAACENPQQLRQRTQAIEKAGRHDRVDHGLAQYRAAMPSHSKGLGGSHLLIRQLATRESRSLMQRRHAKTVCAMRAVKKQAQEQLVRALLLTQSSRDHEGLEWARSRRRTRAACQVPAQVLSVTTPLSDFANHRVCRVQDKGPRHRVRQSNQCLSEVSQIRSQLERIAKLVQATTSLVHPPEQAAQTHKIRGAFGQTVHGL
jgi:hypothetical protein